MSHLCPCPPCTDRTPQEIYPVFPRLRDAETNQPIGATPWTWADSSEEDDSDTPIVVTPAWNPRTGFMQEARDVPVASSESANTSASAGFGRDSAAASSSGSGRADGEPVKSLRVRQRRSNSVQAAPGSPILSSQAVAASRAAVVSQAGELPAVGKGQVGWDVAQRRFTCDCALTHICQSTAVGTAQTHDAMGQVAHDVG